MKKECGGWEGEGGEGGGGSISGVVRRKRAAARDQ